ncbi:hypothetical protein [Tunicatimonas pelagia]|uniref:hypothetical protein n=1 Tax=Tunicatimonas pelagia TaxID=931531 RepID=UPI0026650AA9|nr:hypothetical protein [Tunicatimonas pelagia]WKN42229.1 hypothetical protein P0M28_24635 [Tunicatimonas pelagia]
MDTSWSAVNIDFQYTPRSLQEYNYQNLLTSDIPEEVILAVLSDFRDQPPEEIIHLILEKIVKIVPNKIKLQRYLCQLGVLSKLRNLQPLTFQKLDDMPIEYDIQTDYLFMKGKEAGIEEGTTEGMKEGEKAVIVKILKLGKLNHTQISEFTGISEKRIKQTAKEHNI